MAWRDDLFVEQVLPGAVMRPLAEAELAHYRRPFANPGEDRRPTLTWPRQIPVDGEPPGGAQEVGESSRWLGQSQVPKLYFDSERGALDNGGPQDICRAWPNQTEVEVK